MRHGREPMEEHEKFWPGASAVWLKLGRSWLEMAPGARSTTRFSFGSFWWGGSGGFLPFLFLWGVQVSHKLSAA